MRLHQPENMLNQSLESFEQLQVRVASPESIKRWSFGEVKKAETINYRTLAPEKEGLFCQKIFGPVKDWECACGKYKRIRYRGIVCEVCGVEVTESRVRRYRMAHIGLASPVVHIWFLKGIPSYLSLLLEIPLRDLEQVVYFNAYIVIEVGNAPLKEGQLLTEDEYENLTFTEGHEFVADMGAEAILKLINKMTRVQYETPEGPRHGNGKILAMPGLEELVVSLKQDLKASKSSAQKRVKLIKRLRLVDKMLASSIDPAWMVMESLPVLPPDLRPMVQLDGGRFATSDLNDLYRRVINRNSRLIKLKEMQAPEIIIRNEKRMLQEAVDALIDNGRRGREVVGTNGRRLKSLSDIIEGKQGRFRQNLLGKRVDYSGRSVIVVGPKLKLHQCGVPAPILLELFKPFIIERLIKKALSPNIKTAKKMIDAGLAVVWETLEETIKDHPVLLNRAPTLHRLGIQSFEPVLVEGRAIQLHPLVCSSFNADFDGDQMAIHVPLSIEAQAEARLLMLASNNILLPATGQPSIVPTQDMVLGIYYLTIENPDAANPAVCNGAGLIFSSLNDAISAYEQRLLHLHAQVKLRVAPGELIETTIGRILVNSVIDKVLKAAKDKVAFPFVNHELSKKALSKLFIEIFEEFGTSVTAELADLLKDLGFHYATQAGVTIGIEDLDVPAVKKKLLAEADELMVVAKDLFERGEITEVERYNRVIDTWSETTERLTEEVVKNFSRLNPVYMMAFSGARGNLSQVRQLVGMRGLMADSQGKIIDQPIKTNFREGLSVTEYIISSYGARKGIVDTALKTADSGYLTRRLVDVAQDVIVHMEDCETNKYIVLKPIKDKDQDVLSLERRLFSRTLAEDIVDPKTGKIVAARNQILNRKTAKLVVATGVENVKIRSPLTCESPRGVCTKCYGSSLATNKQVPLGEAIGIIAAQSIGEPGTQLTMRTFHTGGAVAGSGSRKQVRATKKGKLNYDETLTKETRTRYGEIVMQALREMSIDLAGTKIKVPAAAVIKARSGSDIKLEQVVAEYSETSSKMLTERAFKDLISTVSGQILFKDFTIDEKQDRFGNISRTASQNGTIWVMEGQVYSLPSGSEIVVEDGQQVRSGTILSETSTLCEHSGQVRFSPELRLEEGKKDDKPYSKLLAGKEVNIVIASISPENGKLEQTQQGGFLLKVASGEKEQYALKVQGGEIVEDGALIGELQPQSSSRVDCSGEIRYAPDLAIDEKRTIEKGKVGTIYFIPEEIHSISKDISLKNIESGDTVVAGQEVVKDVIARIDGIAELKIENDIIYEVVIRPGSMHKIVDLEDLLIDSEQIVMAGTEVIKGVKAKKTSLVNLVTNPETGEVTQLFLRPVQEFVVKCPDLKLKLEASNKDIRIETTTQLLYKDGDRVRNLEGGQLMRTNIMLHLDEDLKLLKGSVSTENNHFSISIQDSVILRKDSEFSTTYLLLEDGQKITAGDVIAKTQVQSDSDGEIRLSHNDERKLLLITTDHLFIQEHNNPETELQVGALIKRGDKLNAQTESPEVACSGQVVAVTDKNLIILKGRPYLISSGTQLQIESGSLVQRGDQLATLIFEQQKTGDIVQGLPRVEELLEGRKPKEPAIIATLAGMAKVEPLSSGAAEFRVLITAPGGEQVSLDIPIALNIIIDEECELELGQAITDGPCNPHQIMELMGQEAVQLHLINEVQSVYCSQGVDISDKHIEVIVKQMTMKVKVEDPGETIFLPGELIELAELQVDNLKIEGDEERATYKHVLLGITKASLNTKSFISAASFQETTRILSESALEGKTDELRGLKENVIVGKLIPAGTGYAFKLRRRAALKLEADTLAEAELKPYELPVTAPSN